MSYKILVGIICSRQKGGKGKQKQNFDVYCAFGSCQEKDDSTLPKQTSRKDFSRLPVQDYQFKAE